MLNDKPNYDKRLVSFSIHSGWKVVLFSVPTDGNVTTCKIAYTWLNFRPWGRKIALFSVHRFFCHTHQMAPQRIKNYKTLI